MNNMLEIVAPVGLVVGIGLAWYFAWVQPRTEFLNEVMDCMGTDSSEEAYHECAKRVSEGK